MCFCLEELAWTIFNLAWSEKNLFFEVLFPVIHYDRISFLVNIIYISEFNHLQLDKKYKMKGLKSKNITYLTRAMKVNQFSTHTILCKSCCGCNV